MWQGNHSFLSEWLDFLKDFKSAQDAPQTQLQHCYYDGAAWKAANNKCPAQAGAKCPVVWHTGLYRCILDELLLDLQEPKKISIVILCFLRNTIPTLEALVNQLCDSKSKDRQQVQVKTVDSMGGATADIVYLLHHRRFVHCHDQFCGIQTDEHRWYEIGRAHV